MLMWITPQITVVKNKIIPKNILASFAIKPSLGSISNGGNDVITDLLVISPTKAMPQLDIVFFSTSACAAQDYLGGISVKSARYYPVFEAQVAEYHDLRIPVKATGGTSEVYGFVVVPPQPLDTKHYEKLDTFIFKFGVQWA